MVAKKHSRKVSGTSTKGEKECYFVRENDEAVSHE